MLLFKLCNLSLFPDPCPTLLPYIASVSNGKQHCVNCLEAASLSSPALQYAPFSLSPIIHHSPEIRLTTV